MICLEKKVKNKPIVLLSAVELLIKNPLLFLPKLFVAVLYGFSTLFAASLAKTFFLVSASPQSFSQSDLQFFFALALGLFVLTIVAFFVDLFISGLYPLLVVQALKGKVSFIRAMVDEKTKLVSLFISGVLLWILITIVSFIESGIIVFFGFKELGIVVSFAVSFVFIFVFYFLFPQIIFGKSRVKDSFFFSVKESVKNKKAVFIYSLIPFSVSVMKFVSAFFVDSLGTSIVFWGLVLLTGIIYSVHAVSNQILYSKIQK